ncbi:hypothetical protein DdX_11825 [Ditylenchus destructor]|uniref:Uncharacterized protein n=1 Tax=Ditylenchus destructor TaxID=166010 RepID=A0AAD4MYN5_9BILA|nr:hypothetical protein DdX_11825 [Ditylenchus destructor]
MLFNSQFILVATVLLFIVLTLEFSECGDGEKRKHRKHSSHHDSRRDSGSKKSRSSTARQSSASADVAKERWDEIKNALRFKKAKFLIGVDKYDTQRQIVSEHEERAMGNVMADIYPSLVRKFVKAYGNASYKYQKASAEYKAYKIVRSKEFRECMIGKGSTMACQWLTSVPGATPKEAIDSIVSMKGVWQLPLLKVIYYTGKGLRMMKLKRRREPVDPRELDKAIISGVLQELKRTQMGALSQMAAELEVQIMSFFDTCANYLSGVAGSAVDAITAALGGVDLNSDELEHMAYGD